MDGFCVHCDQRIDLGPWVSVGRRVTCPACGAYLEVISLSPVELDWAYDGPHQDQRQTSNREDRLDTWSKTPGPQ